MLGNLLLTILTMNMHRHLLRSIVGESNDSLCLGMLDHTYRWWEVVGRCTSTSLHRKSRTRRHAIVSNHLRGRKIRVNLLLERLDFKFVVVNDGVVHSFVWPVRNVRYMNTSGMEFDLTVSGSWWVGLVKESRISKCILDWSIFQSALDGLIQLLSAVIGYIVQ